MKHLAANGLVTEVGKDLYRGTPFSASTDDPTIAGSLIYSFEGMIPTFRALPEFLAKTNYQVPTDANNGPVQYGLHTDLPFFGYLQANERVGKAFNNFMTGYAKVRPRWHDYYPVIERLGTGLRTDAPAVLLVDVGGGLGHEIAGFHAQFAQLPGRLILQDQESVISQVKNSTEPLSPAITPLHHDFFTPQPPECHSARAYFCGSSSMIGPTRSVRPSYPTSAPPWNPDIRRS